MIIWHLHDPGRLKAFGYDMWIKTIELHGETAFELYSEWHKKTTVHETLGRAKYRADLWAEEIDAFRKKDIAKTSTEILEKAFCQTRTAERELSPIGRKWEQSGYSNLNPEPIKQTWYHLDLFDGTPGKREQSGYSNLNPEPIKKTWYHLYSIDGTPGKITREFCARSDDLAIEDCVDFLKTTAVPWDTAFLYREKAFYPIQVIRGRK